jgi:hypothetical protein
MRPMGKNISKHPTGKYMVKKRGCRLLQENKMPLTPKLISGHQAQIGRPYLCSQLKTYYQSYSYLNVRDTFC